MTQYFDAHGGAIARMRAHAVKDTLGWARHSQHLDAIDREIVWDASLCTEFEGFPDDLRQRVNKVILKYSAASQPVNGKDPCYDTGEMHFDGILNMVSDLHTIFHELSERNIRGFSDDPRFPLRVMYSRAEEKREGMVE